MWMVLQFFDIVVVKQTFYMHQIDYAFGRLQDAAVYFSFDSIGAFS